MKIKEKVAISDDFLTLAGAAGLGTPAQNFAGPPRVVGLALHFIYACQLSAPNRVGSLTSTHYPIKKLSIKESFFIGWQEDAGIKEKSAQLYNVLVNHYNEILAMKDQVKLIKSLLDA